MTDIESLISNTEQLERKIFDFLNGCDSNYDPQPILSDDVVTDLTFKSHYAMESKDKKMEKEIRIEWTTWHKIMEQYKKHDETFHQDLFWLDGIIKNNWRHNKEDVVGFQNRISRLFETAITILTIEKNYNTKPREFGIETGELIINIESESTQITIDNPILIYQGLNEMISKSQLTESEKKELQAIFDEGMKKPQDVGILKKASKTLHRYIDGCSSEISLVGVLLQALTSAIR